MKKILALLIVLTFVAAPAYAGYDAGAAGDKLVRSIDNMLFGWTELLTEPYDAVKNNTGIVTGVADGLVNFVGDTVGGVINFFTFPCSHVNVDYPEGGVGILKK